MVIFRSSDELPTAIPAFADENEGLCLTLLPEESRHLRALRLRAGAQILVSNGKGRRIEARLLSETKLLLRKETQVSPTPPGRILAVAIPEGRRWDWLLQKSAELGATHLLPLLAQRSQRSSYPKERSQKILREACSQSQNFHLPLLHEAQKAEEILESGLVQNLQNTSAKIVLLSPGRGSLLSLSPAECQRDMVFFIGPEGGFTMEEEELLLQAGATACHLGNRILRIETAALTALARSLC